MPALPHHFLAGRGGPDRPGHRSPPSVNFLEPGLTRPWNFVGVRVSSRPSPIELHPDLHPKGQVPFNVQVSHNPCIYKASASF